MCYVYLLAIYRYALVGLIATPLLFIAGAGAALFWTLGVTGKLQLVKLLNRNLLYQATLIGGHASLRHAAETPDPFAQEV